MKLSKNIKKDTIPNSFSLVLAIFDAVPVVLFSIAIILFGVTIKSPLFFVGGSICVISGIIKVLWKILLVIKKRNIWWMFIQMRFAMGIGFILMIVSLIVNRNQENVKDALTLIKDFPVFLFLIITVVGMLGLVITASLLDSSKNKTNWIEQSINTITQLSLLNAVIFLSISVGYYKADTTALNALKTDSIVSVQENDNQYTFSSISGASTKGLIFYPGGKVEYKAYAPLMKQIASKGITCYMVEMPLNYAWLGTNKADSIIESNKNISSWYIAGHSLGGAIAGTYAEKNKDKLDGVILLGAYTTSSLSDLSVLSVYGTEDKVLSKEKYDKYKSNLTDSCVEVVIPGGNHSYFGSYGQQEGDGKATITPLGQWTTTTNAIISFIK